MDEHILRDEEGASLYDARSILSASTSSRVTLTGPRQRPKGPRTSDISRSPIPEFTTLPLSPLAKEVSTVSEESSYQVVTSSASNNTNHNYNNFNNFNNSNNLAPLSPVSPPPRRKSFVARLSFRRPPSRSQHEPERIFADDPFRATPHPSVRWDASNFQEPLLVNNQSVKLSERFSLTTESSPKNLVSLKTKRSFFRRMADKLMRAHYTPSPDSDSPKTQFATVKDHYHTESPITYLSSQLPTPSSPSSGSPLPIVSRLDTSSSAQGHIGSSRTLSSFTSPDTVAVRTLPVLSTDGGTITSVTPGESVSSPEISGPSESLYHVHSVSPSWQPITPVSPSRENHASVDNAMGNQMMHSLHAPVFYSSPSTPGDMSNYYDNRKAMSMRSIPITRNASVLEKRGKAMSVRSQRIEPSNGFELSARIPGEGGNRALVDLDKVMFEKELARERESKVPKEDKSARVKKSASYTARVEPTTPSMKSKRQPNTSLMDRGNFHSFKPLPPKPNSAPNPSKRGLVNLDTSSEVNIPSGPLSIIHFSRGETDRLYPDVLYTASRSNGPLFPLSGNNLSTRSLRTQRSPRSLPETVDEGTSQTYGQNGRDKVSRWLASTSRSDELANPAYLSPTAKVPPSNTELDELVEETVPKHRDKGKGRAF